MILVTEVMCDISDPNIPLPILDPLDLPYLKKSFRLTIHTQFGGQPVTF